MAFSKSDPTYRNSLAPESKSPGKSQKDLGKSQEEGQEEGSGKSSWIDNGTGKSAGKSQKSGQDDQGGAKQLGGRVMLILESLVIGRS